MISENMPRLCSPGTTPDDRDPELLDCALNARDTEDQWVDDFIKRLNYAVQDLGRK